MSPIPSKGDTATAVLRDSATGQSEGRMAHSCAEVEWAVGWPGAEEIPGWSAGLGLRGSPWGVLSKSPRPGPTGEELLPLNYGGGPSSSTRDSSRGGAGVPKEAL